MRDSALLNDLAHVSRLHTAKSLQNTVNEFCFVGIAG